MQKSIKRAEQKTIEMEHKSHANESYEQLKKIQIRASKPISQIKKGDKIKVDSLTLEVDAHYVLIDHKTTKEMVIELYNPKTNKEYQLRYFSDQVETSLEFYELNEIIYNKIEITKVEW